ncbi:MAG: methylmalonyl-CoA epimerase [Pseudobdellovibrionaceae bacterium]
MKIKLAHIGIAVNSLDEGGKVYEILGLKRAYTEVVESEKVKVVGYKLDNDCELEFLKETCEQSAIARFKQKKGPGIHHICLEVDDIHEALKLLKKEGVRLVGDVPRRGANNCLVAFVHPSAAGGVLIELSQKQLEKNLFCIDRPKSQEI